MFDITPIIEAFMALIVVLVVKAVIPQIKANTSYQQQKEINAWIKIAVKAAEQIYLGHDRGPEKKNYVIEWLADHNISVNEDRIDAMIEAAVFEMNKGVIPYE